MKDAKRPLLLPWIHTVIVAIVLAIPTYIVPRYIHEHIEMHGELPRSSLLSGIMGFVQWIQTNIVLVVIILGVFSLDYFVSNKLKTKKAKAIYTGIVALSAIMFVGVLIYLFNREMTS
jgi:type II secretory pathway component PulF